MRPAASRALGLAAAFRGPHRVAAALAVADSRRWVRACFLASAVQSGLLPAMRTGSTLAGLTSRTGATRVDRLESWLAVGEELGELRRRGDRYFVAGRRARALSGGSSLLEAHYRSMLEYQIGPYRELADLLVSEPERGLDDLDLHARTIAEVSLAAAPFVVPFLRKTVEQAAPEHTLDVGCGTGVYIRALLDIDPVMIVEGVELSAEVASETAERLGKEGLSRRATVHQGDVRTFEPPGGHGFDLVTLCNNIYYFAREERVALYRRLGSLLVPGGSLVVTTMTHPGSIASAHLHLMLCCQSGSAGLPRRGEIESDLRVAGFEAIVSERLVPTEPFVGVSGRFGHRQETGH